MADDRLIVALDVSTMDAVKEIVLSLGESVSFYKVGMELFYAEGAKTIRFLQEQNKQVFLDLKLHDIPNTVAHGVASLTRLGASLITLHGQGGPVMMKAAVEAARESGKELGVERPKLLAITALTSFDDESWTAIGGQLPISDQVIRLAKLAKDLSLIHILHRVEFVHFHLHITSESLLHMFDILYQPPDVLVLHFLRLEF